MSRRKPAPPAPAPVIRHPHPLGPTARVLALRPPIAFGGHCFRVWESDAGELFESCVGCHVTVPGWAVREQLGGEFGLARWCQDLFRMLPAAVPACA